jgi:hypothetical protein
MGDSGLVPMTSRKVSLIWGVLFSCTEETYSASWSTPPGIKTKSSLSSARYRCPSSSLASTPSLSCLISTRLLAFCASLSYNFRLTSLSFLRNFRNSFVFLSCTPPSMISFCTTSDCFTTLFTFLIEVDIGGHPPFPADSKQFSNNFDNLLFLAVFRVLNFWSRFEALNDVFWGM